MKISIDRAVVRMSSLTVVATLAFAGIAMPVNAADMNKVIRHVFPAGEEGFDPAAAHDLYSGTVEQAIFETLLTYDYLARPAKLVPLTAEALPQITDNGHTYTSTASESSGPSSASASRYSPRRRVRA